MSNTVPAKTREAVAERSQGICQRCYQARATEIHHLLLRSRGGGHDLDNLVHLCAQDHVWAHANPVAAEAEGFMRHSWDAG